MLPRPIAAIIPCLLALAASAALAQEKGAASPAASLDDMIATALRSSPEILLAEAKLRQAQAELNQARLKVTREVVTAFNEKKHTLRAVSQAERALIELQRAAEAGAAARPEVERAGSQVGEAELKLAQTDAALRYLLGVGGQVDQARSDPLSTTPRPKAQRPAEAPEALIAALERMVTGPFENTNLGEVAKQLSEEARVSILVDPQAIPTATDVPISMALRAPLPLVAALQALADQYDLCFLLRDYGILATTEDRARMIRARSIPEKLPLDEDAR